MTKKKYTLRRGVDTLKKYGHYSIIFVMGIGMIGFLYISIIIPGVAKYASYLKNDIPLDNYGLSMQADISLLIPDVNFLTLFRAQEEELDALGASRAHFITIEQDLLSYKDKASLQKENQEKSLKELSTLQENIKINQKNAQKEAKKLENDISTLEIEKNQLEKKQKETEELLKKFYQQKYIQDIHQDKNVTFMTLLLPKTFGASIQESEILNIMQLFSQSLIIFQKDTQKKIIQTLHTIEYQRGQRVRMAINLQRYDLELTETKKLETALLGKTISQQGAIKDNIQDKHVTTSTISQKFEQKFAEYEIDIQKYSEQYDCAIKTSEICTWIFGYIKAEKESRTQNTRIETGVLPMNTESGFGFHFRDQKYYNIHNEHHIGLDIIAPKNTPVKALNDGYIIAQRNASPDIPGIIIIKHRNGFMTIYRNIQPKKDLKLFGIVKKGEEIGSLGSLIEHSDKNNLHIEMYLRGVLTDPMEQISLENTAIKNIPGRYGWKYIDDMKKAQKEVDIVSVQKTIGFFYIAGENELERQKNMLKKYAGLAFRDPNMWVKESLLQGVDPSFTLCVGFAESTLGQNLTTNGNVGNVGNTDGGDRRDYVSPREGVRAIAAVVNNQWLGHYQTIDQLSGWGNNTGAIYASSPTNWHENIVKCLSALKGKYVGNYSTFRLNQV